MNFKNIQIILTYLAFSSSVLSSPILKDVDANNDFLNKRNINEFVNDIKEGIVDEVKYLVNDNADENNVCSTAECKNTSTRILSMMNADVNPCDDFYQFACGKYEEQRVIPEDKEGISSFYDVVDGNYKIIHEILEGDYKAKQNLTAEQQELDKKIFVKVKDIYNTCMDTKTINSKGKEPLVKLLEQLGIDKNKDNLKSPEVLTDIVSQFININSPIFVDTMIEGDLKNSDNSMLYFKQPSLTLPSKEYYENEELISLYQDVIKDMFKNISGNDDSGNFFTKIINFFFGSGDDDSEKFARSIIELEKKLAVIMVPPEQTYDFSIYDENTVKSLNEKYQYINWTTLFGKLFSHIQVKDDTPVYVVSHNYFDGLNKILKETDVDTLAAYAKWLVIKSYGDYIGDDVKQPLKKFVNTLTGVTKDPERYEYCIDIVNPFVPSILGNVVGKSMNMAISKYYVDEVFSGDNKKIAEELINNIKEAMKKRIPQMTWLDKETAQSALEKVNTMTDKIGYPDFIMSPEKLDEEYRDLNIVNNDFFANIVNLAKFSVARGIKTIYKPRDRTEWGMAPAVVNAMYNPLSNDITFPAGILRPPFFSSSDPEYLNYGAIGAVIGHEMTHAFDNTGKDFDAKGNLRNWWTNSTVSEFNKLTQCFIDQYGSFTVQDNTGKQVNLNGKLTLGENLADNGGLARAYEAYQMSLGKSDGKKNNQGLPGLTNYTNDQLFYISFGQIWCSKQRPEAALQQVLTDPHSPAKYRVNGSLSNSKHFAEVFKCKTGTPMNPEKKCLIW